MKKLLLLLCALLPLLTACAEAVPSPPPTTVPLPTQIPADELLRRAAASRAAGDAAAAREALAALLIVYPAGPVADQARLQLSAALAAAGRRQEALQTLEPLLLDDQHLLFGAALFLRGRTAAALGDYAAARADFEDYLARDLPLRAYAQLGAAAAAAALADEPAAEALYLAAGQADLAYLRRAEALEAAYALQTARADAAAAAATYRLLLDFARTPDYRRDLLAKAAEQALLAGDTAQARAFADELIADYPGAVAATAVDRLREQQLLPADPAAAVWTYVAADRAADAVAYADLLLPTLSGEAAQSVQRVRGLARRALTQYDAALADLAAAEQQDPTSDQGIQARLDTIQTLGQRGATLGAALAYREFARDLPADRRAPLALDRAIQLYSRLEDAAGVAETTVELARAYPTDPLSHAALHRLAYAAYQRADLVAAHAYWSTSKTSAEGLSLARAAYWAGRSGRELARADANADLALAIQAAPTSYFAARAAESLQQTLQPSRAFAADPVAVDWTALSSWVAGFAAPAAPALQQQVQAVALRAAHLRQIGLDDWAHAEWLDAYRRAEDDPASLLYLASLAAAQQADPVMIQAADRLAELAGKHAVTAPPDLAALRYPTPYAALLLREAAAVDLDPRLLAALVRQESLFNPRAVSWAGARGLAQIMPETAAAIAVDLGVADFSVDTLFSPAISLRFGSFYLSRRLTDLQGSPAAALAAYNGGLGNALRWADVSPLSDPDRFIEAIDFPETRDYVQRVLAGFHQYRLLYDGR
jgi:soluble lytic murein transglycosylase